MNDNIFKQSKMLPMNKVKDKFIKKMKEAVWIIEPGSVNCCFLKSLNRSKKKKKKRENKGICFRPSYSIYLNFSYYLARVQNQTFYANLLTDFQSIVK